MAQNNRRISGIDVAALLFFAVLFVVWLRTGHREWFRYLYVALAFLYIFVVRVVVYNRRMMKEEARFDSAESGER